MRAGQRVEEETRVGKQLTAALRKPPRKLTSLNMYRSPGFPSRCLFPSLCGESSGQRPLHPAQTCTFRTVTTTTQTKQALLPYELGTCPRRSLRSPPAASYIGSQCKFFQDNLHLFFSSKLTASNALNPRTASCLSFPHSPLAAG